jgi:predicted  nucleic acid-binding Zn-ribbon protein
VSSDPIVVNVIPKPSTKVNVFGNLNLCEGESVKLSAEGIGSYLWSNNETSKEIVLTKSGSYTLNIKNEYCNVNSTPIVVNVIAKPSNKVNVSGNLTFCQGDSVKLSADGMGSYMWTNGKTSKEIVVKDAGTYTLNIKNDYCNVNSSPIVVSVNSKPSNKVNVSGNLTFCEGDSIILDAVGEGTYKWSNGSLNKSIIVKEPGKYTVTITKYFCSAVSDIIVANTNPKPILKFNYKDTTINNGEKLTLKVSGAKEYLWNDQSKLDSVVIKDAGKYTVIGKNDLGCSNTASFELKFSGKEVGIYKVNELYLSISPNPVSEILTVSLENYKNNSLTILDLKGNQILTQPLVDYKTEINVNSFAKGIYLVSIIDNTNTVLNTKRFVVE